jgi:hypothetical protein
MTYNMNLTVARTDPVSLRVDQMIEDYFELPFPGDTELFGDLVIYIRKVVSKQRRN